MANEVTILHIFVGTVLHLVSYDIGFLTQYMPLTLSSCINYYYYFFIPQVVKIPGVKNYKS